LVVEAHRGFPPEAPWPARKCGHGASSESTSIGLPLGAAARVTTAGVGAAAIAFAGGTILTPTGVIAAADGTILAPTRIHRAAIAFATGPAFAARTVLASTVVIDAAVAFATRSRAAFATSGAAGTGTTFAAARVAVMLTMLPEGRTFFGRQGGELRRVEHAVAVLVKFGEKIGGGGGLTAVFPVGSAVGMGVGGQREATEDEGECWVHVVGGLLGGKG
jgi:hypothetical protein